MTLIIQKPTGAKLVFRKELPADAEADAYIAAVEAADGQALESGVKFAIKNFVLCCKDDGIWPAIKASCILAGARTLAGALVPLVGTAPTNVGGLFVAGDYNRKTGLVGNGSTKYLDSNRNINADPQDSAHQSVWVSAAPSSGTNRSYIGGGANGTGSTQIFATSTSPFNIEFRNRNSTAAIPGANIFSLNFIGHSRATSSSYNIRAISQNFTGSSTSQTPHNGNSLVFARNSVANVAGFFGDARLAFYSIGESLDLALLDARVTDLINAFAAAIP
jgi:hypothetical protein